jgi:chemotaxis protein methyltransferase CheR
MRGRPTLRAEVAERIARAVAAASMREVGVDRMTRAAQEALSRRGLGEWPAAEPAGLLDEVLDRLTVQESWWFRDPRQWASLVHHVIPALEPPIEAWSAGCANGQEAWTLAMLLADHAPGEWRLTATDVSSRAVARAEEGVYRDGELRGLPGPSRQRYMEPAGDGWRVADGLRRRVRFMRHNLATQPPPVPVGACRLVLCRNVLIYLTDDGVQSALSAIDRALAPDAWLVVGGAESLWALTDRFESVRLPGGFGYRRATAPAAPVAAAPVAAAAAGRPSARPPSAPARRPHADPLPDVAELVGRARKAAERGDHEAAATGFRQAAYLEPDRAEAHAGLAAALDALGHPRAAARARAAAKRAAGMPR